MKGILILVTLIGLGSGIYLIISAVLGIIAGKHEVDQTPKIPMFQCPKHGPISERNVIRLDNYEELYTDEDGKVQSRVGDFKSCSLCYNERLSAAEKIPK